MSWNWLQIAEVAIQEGEAVLADAVQLEADQAVVSPAVLITIDGHKFSSTMHLDPVPGE